MVKLQRLKLHWEISFFCQFSWTEMKYFHSISNGFRRSVSNCCHSQYKQKHLICTNAPTITSFISQGCIEIKIRLPYRNVCAPFLLKKQDDVAPKSVGLNNELDFLDTVKILLGDKEIEKCICEVRRSFWYGKAKYTVFLDRLTYKGVGILCKIKKNLCYKYSACHWSTFIRGDLIIRPQWLLSLSDSKIPGPRMARPTVLLLLIFPQPRRVRTRLVWLRRWTGTWNESELRKIGCLSPSVAGVRFVFTLCPEKISVTLT